MATSPAVLPLHQRFLLSAAIYLGAMGTYFAAGSIARPPFSSLRTPLDDAIPFVPSAMPGYALAYVVPFFTPWIATTEGQLRRLGRTVLLAYLVAAPFFVALPIQDADPPLQPRTAVERLLVMNRRADESKNAFPSMHVGLAALLAFVAWRRSRPLGVVLAACAVVIAVSTLLVKQHFIVDLPAGVLVALVAYRAVHGDLPWSRMRTS